MKFDAVVIFTIFYFHSAFAYSGAISSGGGGSVLLEGRVRPVLVDFAISKYSQDSTVIDNDLRFDDLSPTALMNYLPVDLAPLYSEINLLKDRLDIWEPYLPKLVKVLKTTIEKYIKFFMTTKKLRKFDEANFRRLLDPDAEIQQVVLFDGIFGPIISIPEWNRLDSLSRSGLVLHEALRQIWTVYPESLSEIQITNITSALMLRQPTEIPDFKLSLSPQLSAALLAFDETFPFLSVSKHLYLQLAFRLRDSIPEQLSDLVDTSLSLCRSTTRSYQRVKLCSRKLSEVMCSARDNATDSTPEWKLYQRLCYEDGSIRSSWVISEQSFEREQDFFYRNLYSAVGIRFHSGLPTWATLQENARISSFETLGLKVVINNYLDRKIFSH